MLNAVTASPARLGHRPRVSLVLAAYNEAPIVDAHLGAVLRFADSIRPAWPSEVVVVDDGSTDGTGALVDAVAARAPGVRVVHHGQNGGLGRALRTAFAVCRGEYSVTLDLDLSYSLDHVTALVREIQEPGVAVVVASPYRHDGHLSGVPWARRVPSQLANAYLAMTTGLRLSTYTGMVRAYRTDFVQSVVLTSDGPEINLELLYHAVRRGAKVREIPAHLDWCGRAARGARRRLRLDRRTIHHVAAVLSYGPRLRRAAREGDADR